MTDSEENRKVRAAVRASGDWVCGVTLVIPRLDARILAKDIVNQQLFGGYMGIC